MKNKVIWLFCTILLLCCVAFAFTVKASDEQVIVRVGYPLQKGLTYVDDQGKYAGYTYEYLMTIAQYAGFEYEFVQVAGDTNTQILTLMDMLERGEIDILGAMAYNDSLADKYDFVQNSYGTYSRGLYVMEYNTSINTISLFSMDSIRVAIYGAPDSVSTKELQKYLDGISVTLEPVYVDSVDEQMNALCQGQADVLLANTLNRPYDSLKLVASFNKQPFYFALTKGNTTLSRKMNEAIAEIRYSNPMYEASLIEEYFYSDAQYSILTEDEKQYINQLDTLQVYVLGGRAPIVYRDQDGNATGIAVNLLKYMSQECGLPIEIKITDSMIEYNQAVINGEPDLIICLSNYLTKEFLDQYNVSMPYISVPLYLVVNSSTDISKLEDYEQVVIDAIPSADKIREVPTIEEYLKAVNDGAEAYSYVNGYSVDYYVNHYKLNNIYSYHSDDYGNADFSIGINKELGNRLLTIMNKAIHTIPNEMVLRSYLFENTSQLEEITLEDYLRSNYVEFILTIISMLAILFSLAFLYKYQMERRSKRMIMEHAKRDGLTNLYNSIAFRDIVNDHISSVNSRNLHGFIMMDIDKFKSVNDTYGHQFGDKVIVKVAQLSCKVFCDGEIIGRSGGDEFVIFHPNLQGCKELEQKCQLLKTLLNEDELFKGKALVTVSMGGIIFSGFDTYEKIFHEADEVMYQVKHRGRNGYEIQMKE